jgi:NitT/TauT family transport system substrate-binding protein
MPSGKTALQTLREGTSDFALTAVTPVVLDRLADNTPGQADDPIIIANLVNSMALMQVVVRSRTGITEPQQLAGRRIAIDTGTNAEFVWWLFQSFHQIDDSEIEIVPLNGEATYNALLERRIDGAVLWEPWITRLDEALRGVERSPLHIFDVQQMYSGKWLVMTTPRILAERPGLARRVLAALRRAIEFMEIEPDTARRLYQDRFGIRGEFLITGWDTLDYDLSLDWSLISALQQQFAWATESGHENRGSPIRILDLIDDRLMREHWPIAVGIPARTADQQP